MFSLKPKVSIVTWFHVKDQYFSSSFFVCFVLSHFCSAGTYYVSGQKMAPMNGAQWQRGHAQAGINEVLKDSEVTAIPKGMTCPHHFNKTIQLHLCTMSCAMCTMYNINSICALNFSNSFNFTFHLVDAHSLWIYVEEEIINSRPMTPTQMVRNYGRTWSPIHTIYMRNLVCCL